MHIEMLSTGCSNSMAQLENLKAAIAETGVDAQVETVSDIYRIMDYGVSCCPAIVINGKVRSAGKLLSIEELAALLLFK